MGTKAIRLPLLLCSRLHDLISSTLVKTGRGAFASTFLAFFEDLGGIC